MSQASSLAFGRKIMIKVAFCDSHISEDSLLELEEIFKEICRTKGDLLVMCGDFYENSKPTSKELEFGTKWAYFFKKLYDKVVFVKGNHDKDRDGSVIDYLQYLGIEIVNEYIDEERTFYGHFMTNESLYEYGTAYKKVSELTDYKFVMLGHQHSFQVLFKRIIHPGSIRFINFNESKDECKYYMMKFHQSEWQKIKLGSPIPMQDFKSIKELAKQKNKNIKARLIISSYKQYKEEINTIEEYKNKFKSFKLKLDIQDRVIETNNNIIIDKKKKLEDIIREGIEKVEDEEVKKLLKEALK